MGMSQSGCCCNSGTKTKCSTCTASHPICCLQVEHTLWAATSPILLRPSAEGLWDTDDTCTGPAANEICGYMEVTWGMPWNSQGCLPQMSLSWGPYRAGFGEVDCDRIIFTLNVNGYITTLETNSTWYIRDLEFEDPYYPYLTSINPDKYPPATPIITVRVCPEDYVSFPTDPQTILLKVTAERKDEETGEWSAIVECVGGDENCREVCSVYEGSCYCHKKLICSGQTHNHGVSLGYRYDLYTDTVHINAIYWHYEYYSSGRFTYTGIVDVPYDACGWAEEELVVPSVRYALPDWSVDCSVLEGGCPVRLRIVAVEDCESCGQSVGPEVPTPQPPRVCYKKTLCVLLEAPEGSGQYSYYSLVWNEATDRYELGPVVPPDGSGDYTIEITLEEDPDAVPPGPPNPAIRVWVLTVKIREAVSGDLVYEYTDSQIIDCTQEWSRMWVLEDPVEDDEPWLLSIGTECPDEPDPPECDPGCWPECVMCPTRKSLAIVIDDYPSCCLNSYTLTYDSGTDTYYLPSPVGGPLYTCGWIMTAVVSCVGSSSIHLVIQFKDSDGTLKGSDSVTLTAVCDGEGNMETTTPFEINGSSLICGDNVFTGGRLRVVTI